MEVVFLWVCVGARLLTDIMFINVFSEMSLTTLLITCPNKNNPAKCGKCAGEHKTENCRSKFFKSANCIKGKVDTSKVYEATSRQCPILITEQNQILKRTNFKHEKN